MTKWPAGRTKREAKAIALLHRFLDGKDAREVTTEDVARWATSLPVKRGTLRTYLGTVARYFQGLGLLAPPRIELPRKEQRPLGRVLSKREIGDLLASCNAARHAGLRDRALFEFLYSTGLRASEVRRVRVEDLDLAAGVVTVRNGKGAKDRVVPLTKAAIEWLRRYLAVRKPHDVLFLTRWGKPFGEAMFQKVLQKRGITCHVLRRTVATHLLEGGASPAAVAAILGHVDLETLSRYARVAAKEVKSAHARFHPREKDDE